MEPSLTLMAPASLSHTLNYNLSQTQSRICIKFQSAARTLCTQSHNQILRDDLPRVADPRTPGWACPHRALQVRNHTGGQLVSHTHTRRRPQALRPTYGRGRDSSHTVRGSHSTLAQAGMRDAFPCMQTRSGSAPRDAPATGLHAVHVTRTSRHTRRHRCRSAAPRHRPKTQPRPQAHWLPRWFSGLGRGKTLGGPAPIPTRRGQQGEMESSLWHLRYRTLTSRGTVDVDSGPCRAAPG